LIALDVSLQLTEYTHVEDEIQSAINEAATDEIGTVYLPAGNYLFDPTENGTIHIPTGINLIGAGKDQTFLRNETPVPYADWAWGNFMNLDGINGLRSILKGFSIIGFRELYPDHDSRTKGIQITNAKDYLIQDVRIKDTGGGFSVIDWLSPQTLPTQGVISKCELINTSGLPCGPGGIAYGPNVVGYGIQVDGTSYAENWIDDITQILGNYDYGAPVTFIEDSYFTRWRHCVASNQGAHYVFRHNIIENSFGFGDLDCHGGGYGNRGVGTRAAEIYNNIIRYPIYKYLWNTSNVGVMYFLRGGGGVMFNNTITDYSYILQVAQEGEDPFYYPRDWWMWNNVLNNSGAINPDGIENYHAEALQGYSPYTYPHPLATSTPTPASPALLLLLAAGAIIFS
jgi:hypothetical protein